MEWDKIISAFFLFGIVTPAMGWYIFNAIWNFFTTLEDESW